MPPTGVERTPRRVTSPPKTEDHSICPARIDEWNREVRRRGIGDIHGIARSDAESRLDVDQFLALKVLWKMDRNPKVFLTPNQILPFGTTANGIENARRRLKNDPAWSEYLKACGPPKAPNRPYAGILGRFAIVLQNQRIVATHAAAKKDRIKVVGSPITSKSGAPLGRSGGSSGVGVATVGQKTHEPPRGAFPLSTSQSLPSRSRSIEPEPKSMAPKDTAMIHFDYEVPIAKRTERADEQLVAVAAISFLQALCIQDTYQPAFWSPIRKPFRFGQTNFKAYVDGYLQQIGESLQPLDRGVSAAVLNVTARKRPPKNFEIEWQESAQMALWIREEQKSFWTTEKDPQTYHRMLISQNHSEIYLIIAEYESSYVRYLQGQTSIAEADFLTMHRLGPFDTEKGNDMDLFGGVLQELLHHAIKPLSAPDHVAAMAAQQQMSTPAAGTGSRPGQRPPTMLPRGSQTHAGRHGPR